MFDFNFRWSRVNNYIGIFVALFIAIGGIIQAKIPVESFVDAIKVVIGTIGTFLLIRKYMSVFSNLIYELMN